MRILIADDEFLQRENLVRLVREANLDFERIDACDNAIDALAKIEEYQPEIILTDICMPEMSGAELALEVHRKYPEKVIIFISGHEEFEYAHAGIEAQVFDYILKPIDPARTIRCIARAKEACMAEKQKREQYAVLARFMEEHLHGMQQQFVESLLLYSQETNAELIRRKQALFHMDFQRYRLVVNRSASHAEGDETAYYYAYETTRFIREEEPEWITLSIGGIVYLIAPLPDERQPGEDSALLRRLNQLNVRLTRQYQQRFHVAVSNVSADLRELKMLKAQTALCLERMLSSPADDLLFYEDIDASRRKAMSMSAELERLSTCARAGNREAVRITLTELFDSFGGRTQDMRQDAVQLAVSQLLLAMKEEGVADAALQAQGEKMFRPHRENGLTLPVLLAFADSVCEAVCDVQSRISNLLISQVMDFINERFAQPIGLAEAAEHVQRTPAYISRLFSQCAHTTFTRALTEKRIAEAKRLLGDTALTVADVALQTGYPNVRYFYRVFQTQVGMTANDYRKVVAALS
ncbi:MAG: response regulator [Eubacteriales bacterium]|nr:response regulator [Eubacteriales bacterium]